MNVVCLNCEKVSRTVDPRKKFCDKVCRNRFNVRKSLAKPRKKKVGIEALREMVRKVEKRPLVRASMSRETYQKDEWIDP